MPTDIKNVKVDELTDAQIKQYMAESEKSGIPEAQQESLALKNGMPPSELSKLKERVEKIRASATTVVPNTSTATPPENTPPVGTLGPPTTDKVVVVETTPLATSAPVEAAPINPQSVYGHHLFKDNNLLFFEKASDVKAPDSYIIGPNDELTVSVFGFSYFNEVLKVDARGAINPTNIGPIMLKGIEFGKAKELIRSKFSQFFDLSNNQLTVTLSYSRVININFVGEVVKPGSYKIPALNTAFNALIAVGGPSALGSVRNIQIRRNGKTIKVLDVYEFLNDPNSKMNFYLEDNDYLYVAPSEKTVSVTGAVKRPMKYELKGKESLEDLIFYAGGLTAGAYTKLIRVSRLGDDGTQLQMINISLDSLKANRKKYELKDGDLIEIGDKVGELRQYIEISGSAFRPGKYEFRKGDKLSDLINRANGLKPEARLDKAYLIRTNPDRSKEYFMVSLENALASKSDTAVNLMLQEGDLLKVASKIDFLDAKSITAAGLFRKPTTIDYFPGARLTDVIFLAGGLREEANKQRAFVVRIRPDFTKEFLNVNMEEAMAAPEDSTKNIFLQPGDAISVISVTDFIDKMNVSAIGLFRSPGNYAYANGMTLSDLLLLAGGLKMEADLLNVEVSRISFFADDYKQGDASRVIIKVMQVGKDTKLTPDQLDFKLNPFDQIFVRMVPDFELPKNLTISGEVKYPGTYALAKKDEHLDELIKRAGGLNRFSFAEGATLYRPSLPGSYVVMNLKKALSNKHSRFNYILKEGDVLNIPRVIDLIGIQGDVEYLTVVNQTQVNSPYVQGKRAGYYVKEFANGFTSTSFKRKTYVVENNGKVSRTKNFYVFKIYPKVKKGSIIYVVSKPVKEKNARKQAEPVNWTKVIENTTVKITGLITLYLLLRTVAN
ncbi:MAG: SLBB domain-containing protein [Bacteroidota bacterium]